MALAQLLYLLAACRVTLTYPVCGVLVLLADLTFVISTLTLVVMSLERYVAVCYPLRHSTIITIRNTAVAIIVVWAFSSLNIITQVILLLDFPFKDLESLQMKDLCAKENMFHRSDDYDKAYTLVLFVSASVAIISSYIRVMIAARSAATDKASARKARNTLLLHLVQLGLSLSATMHNPLLIAISKVLNRIVFVRIRIVVYVFINIFPRCLSALIYGIRDQTIRPILLYYLCCRLKLSVITARAKSIMSAQTNFTVGQRTRGILEIVLFSAPITVPCCVFLFINGTMLFTLRSKTVFRETSRYILLFNLLSADTVQMALSQLLYLLAACRVTLTYPVCGVLAMLADLTGVISPLTLVVMSLERYVAVCYPLRHSTIVTIRNTAVAIIVVWAFSSLNILAQVILMLDFPFKDLESLQMKRFCAKENIVLGPRSDDYDKAYTLVLFVSASVAIISSFIGVMIAARSASTDKASARKARNTLLLHLVQLGLSLSSTIQNPLLIAISKITDRITILRIQSILYVFVILFPRCLSTLIYGIRDKTLRSILVHRLCCQLKLPIIPAKAEVSH
ncbi:LOW QUALITY PROTEIN: olfactory receptor 2AK2-like [Cottoperca gobio]|uniref:LOW QUALITY PROTEIN: olfactory receptor 2AK2-like n=1 Tax=Cottoperca gobio TaxID=56716 RepID=A0A6J2R0U8_COTGO|nr:LOW QUALITY PROTEIN: olfactory receptor 2AK2-like [Cottoperca gobio]